MGGAERVGHVQLRRRRELLGEFGVVALLLLVEAHILQQQHAAVGRGGHRRSDLIADAIVLRCARELTRAGNSAIARTRARTTYSTGTPASSCCRRLYTGARRYLSSGPPLGRPCEREALRRRVSGALVGRSARQPRTCAHKDRGWHGARQPSHAHAQDRCWPGACLPSSARAQDRFCLASDGARSQRTPRPTGSASQRACAAA